MKCLVSLIIVTCFFVGCCTKCPPKPHHDEPTTNSLPRAVEEFDGKKNYQAQATEYPNIWAIILPNTKEVEQITSITVWANTTSVEGHRVGTNIYCDQIQLVNDDPAHTIIASQDIFRTEMQNATKDTDEVTKGYALGSGDVFTLNDGSDTFKQLRASLSKARIFIRLVNKQPNPHTFHVDNAKVQADLSK